MKNKYFDEKQKSLIKSWHDLASKSLIIDSYYTGFISEWIAFNAVCYNLYNKKASNYRADLDRDKSKLNDIEQRLRDSKSKLQYETLISFYDEKLKIQIESPDKLYLSIKRKYTEDIIYDLFVKEYDNWFKEYCPNINDLLSKLQNSLHKKCKNVNRYYVINMSRISDYSIENNVDLMNSQNIVVLFEEFNLRSVKNVLYQIRCNIFHGEKIPGDINDDRIVKTAFPILQKLVNKLIYEYKIIE